MKESHRQIGIGRSVAASLAGLMLWGCGGSTPPPTPQPAATRLSETAPSSKPAEERPRFFLGVSYVRSGGFAGLSRRVLISADGSYVVSQTNLGQYIGKLSAEQLAGLAKAFEGWNQLADSYPAPKGTADDFQYEIHYGPKTVLASDASKDLPESFRKAIAAVDAAVKAAEESKTGK